MRHKPDTTEAAPKVSLDEVPSALDVSDAAVFDAAFESAFVGEPAPVVPEVERYTPMKFDIAQLRSDALANMAARHNRAYPSLLEAIDGLIVQASATGSRSAVLIADIDTKLCEMLKRHYEGQGEKLDVFKVTFVPVNEWPERDGYFKVMW